MEERSSIFAHPAKAGARTHDLSSKNLDPASPAGAETRSETPVSRLDSFIRRMQAQRLLLDHAARAIVEVEGPVLELGLGNGRTYHHLREKLPGRRIIAFDIKVTAQPDCVPAPEDLVLGDIRETAPRFAGIKATLVHCDLGSGIPERDRETLLWLPSLIPVLLAPDGLVLSDLELDNPQLLPQALPAGVARERYWMYGLRQKPVSEPR